MSNEQELPEIDIAYVNTDEVQAWKRPIALRFKGNSAKVSLYWNNKDGYSAIIEQFFDGWTQEEQVEFIRWTGEQENLTLLNEETEWTPALEEEEEDSATDHEIEKQSRLQVLIVNWQGKPKAQIQLLTDDDQWLFSTAIALGDYSLATIGQMMALVLLGYQSAIQSEIPTQVGYRELVDQLKSQPDSGLEEFLAWLVSFENFN